MTNLTAEKEQVPAHAGTIEAQLVLMQHADSQFPSGSFAFSAGLEQLFADGHLRTPADIAAYIKGHLRHRWACCDRIALVRSFRSRGNHRIATDIDRELEAMTLSAALREGSKRNGRALLGVHCRLDTPGAAAYQNMIRQGTAKGHVAVVQGLVWQALNLDERQIQIAAAHGVVTDTLTAALRLGRLGHIQLQQIRASLNYYITGILGEDVGDDAIMQSYLPVAEIASMRHETGYVRMFAS